MYEKNVNKITLAEIHILQINESQSIKKFKKIEDWQFLWVPSL